MCPQVRPNPSFFFSFYINVKLMKGIQTVAVFVSSAFLFCAIEEAQCITPPKFGSIVAVLLGTLIYSLAPADRTVVRFISISIYIYPSIYIYTYIHIYIYIYMYIYVCIYTYTYTYMHMYVCMFRVNSPFVSYTFLESILRYI